MRSDHGVGRLACQLFPGGVEPAHDRFNLAAGVAATHALLKRGVPIYEASSSHSPTFARVDILVPTGAETWAITRSRARGSEGSTCAGSGIPEARVGMCWAAHIRLLLGARVRGI